MTHKQMNTQEKELQEASVLDEKMMTHAAMAEERAEREAARERERETERAERAETETQNARREAEWLSDKHTRNEARGAELQLHQQSIREYTTKVQDLEHICQQHDKHKADKQDEERQFLEEKAAAAVVLAAAVVGVAAAESRAEKAEEAKEHMTKELEGIVSSLDALSLVNSNWLAHNSPKRRGYMKTLHVHRLSGNPSEPALGVPAVAPAVYRTPVGRQLKLKGHVPWLQADDSIVVMGSVIEGIYVCLCLCLCLSVSLRVFILSIPPCSGCTPVTPPRPPCLFLSPSLYTHR